MIYSDIPAVRAHGQYRYQLDDRLNVNLSKTSYSYCDEDFSHSAQTRVSYVIIYS